MKTKKHGPGYARKYTADPTTAQRLLSRCSAYSEAEIVSQKLPVRMAYDAIKKGNGTKSDYDNIAYDLNDATVLSDETCNQEYVAICDEARAAMVRVLERYNRTGKVGFDGPAIESVLGGIELYEAFIEFCTPAQMIAAGMESNRRVLKSMVTKKKVMV